MVVLFILLIIVGAVGFYY
ncbi:MAG TPA: YjcZ family sporulation protein [Bacillales bacterium]|nr:YjcZ family sporulation protein [Bacillales bacterium]